MCMLLFLRESECKLHTLLAILLHLSGNFLNIPICLFSIISTNGSCFLKVSSPIFLIYAVRTLFMCFIEVTGPGVWMTNHKTRQQYYIITYKQEASLATWALTHQKSCTERHVTQQSWLILKSSRKSICWWNFLAKSWVPMINVPCSMGTTIDSVPKKL